MVEARGATMVGAEREIFELLQPLDCRKRRFQSPNFTLNSWYARSGERLEDC